MDRGCGIAKKFSKALFAIVSIAIFWGILSFAANASGEDLKTYDFSDYADSNDAVASGWSVSGGVPDGALQTATVSTAGDFVGVSDYVTREGKGLYENLSLTYVIPEADRILLSEYAKMTFSRKLVNADGFLVSGARYAVILKTDNDEVIRIEKDWISKGITENQATESCELQKEFSKLSSDSKLYSVTFVPYVNSEDFRPETAYEKQLLVQFFVSNIVFSKASEMPVVYASEDTWNGTSVTEHNGKITGLNSECTYEYKLTYDTEWKSVSGVTEITGLEGAAYLIRQSAGVLPASEAVTVSVPKTFVTGVSYSKEQVAAGEFTGIASSEPVIGAWTSYTARVYNAVGRLTVGTNYYYILGLNSPEAGQSTLECAYYRRNVLKLEYTLTAEEQIDFSKSMLSFATCCNGSFPYSSYGDVSGIMEIYVAGRDEPIVIDNIRHTSGDRYYKFKLSDVFPNVEGYIERIVYYPFYNQDIMPSVTNNYPQLSNFFISEVAQAPAPELLLIDMEDGTYKISGFKGSLCYEISYDKGNTWQSLPEGINYLEGVTEGVYYIRVAEDDTYFAGIPAIVSVKSHRTAPTEFSVSDNSIIGLDPSCVYEYAPYSIAEDMSYTEITGVSSIGSLTPGLWAVRYVEDEDNFASDPGFYYIEGSENKGKVNIVAQARDSEKRGFVTGEICSDVLPISFYNDTNTPSASLVMYNGWTKTTDMSINETLNVTYAFEYDQVFDIKELYQFYYTIGFSGSGVYLNSGSLTGFYNKIRFYVAGSDVEYYDVYSPWTTTSKITFNAGAALPADAHGYVVGYKFYYYGMWPEISDTMKSGSPYPRYTIYDISLTEKVATPRPIVSNNSSGGFTVSGLKSEYLHGYSTDGKNYIKLAKGANSFTVSSAGTYYIYAENADGIKSEVVSVDVGTEYSEATVSLFVSGNSVCGFNEKFLYEYRKYSLTDTADYISLASGTAVLDNLDAGLWEIRQVGEKSAYFLIYGEKNGTVSFNALYYAGGDKWNGEKGWAQGRWTSSSSACYLDSVSSASTVRLATNWVSSLDQDALDSFYFSYQLTDDEIVPISETLPFTYYVSFGNTNPYSNPSVTRIRYYVVGSDVEYYDVLVTNPGKGVSTTADVLSANPNAKGYVVGIRIWPYAYFPEGTTLAANENRYPVLKITGVATGETDPRLISEINFARVLPKGIYAEEADGNLWQTYKLKGFDADRLYEYSFDGGNTWTALDAGTTEIGPIVGGTYTIRYAATESSSASGTLTIVTPTMTPSFIGRDISLYPNIVSSDMASGFWTSSPSGLDKTASPTTYIGSTTVLNTVKYAYTFAIEHQFTVSDYPFFVIDFNNELLNFNSSTRFIDGAEIAVDIYFVGKDEPYTVTGDWAGYTISADGTTPNRMFVDLLALDPTLADETVYAFAIRPYSNIYLTPQNYNTSASADRYIYFRLLNAGFYSTVQNVSAITSQTHSKVNDFEKIALENVPKYLNVGDTLLPSDITVKAYYTDGTESEVNTASAIFDIPAFNSPGIYTVSVLYRGSIAQTDVAVGITPNTVELYTLPDKTVYYVGQSFNSNGLSFKYLLSDGSVVLNENDYKISPVIFDTAGTVTVNVEFLNETFTFTVKVIPQESALKLSDESEWMLNSDTKKLTGLVERTTVAQLTAAFDVDVVVFDLKGNDVTSQTSLLVGTGFKVATMYNGEIADTADIIVKGDVNGNGRIDTNDYLLVKRAYINTIVIPEDSDIFTAADVNGNGIIDTNDYLKIKNHFRGTVNLFD